VFDINNHAARAKTHLKHRSVLRLALKCTQNRLNIYM